MAQAQRTISAVDLNNQQRAAIQQRAFEYKRIIFSQTFANGASDLGKVISIPVQNTGLLKKFIVETSATISGGSSAVQTRQALGNGNIFSRVQFWDFSNKERINTSGWHLNAIAAAKRGRAMASAYTSDTPNGIGANLTTIETAPSSISATASANNVFSTLEVPVCRDDYDWRGIVNANVTNATARLELTINPQLFASSSENGVLSLYKSGSSTKGTLDSITVTVYQIGFDQATDNNGNPILPILDAAVAYMLTNTVETGLTANQEIKIAFANNRTFLSLFALIDNGGTLYPATDVNRFALESANWTRFQEIGSRHAAFVNREKLGGDLAAGMYYFSFMDRPINTLVAGNVTFCVNMATVNTGARVLLGWESFADLYAVSQAVSIGV